MRYQEFQTEGTRCWKGYEKKGMKTMFGKRVPNCVKNESDEYINENLTENYDNWDHNESADYSKHLEKTFGMPDEVTDEQTVWVEKIQSLLDSATILIGHNIVHDLMWLWESNFKYEGPVFDTMLGEYVIQRGNKQPLSLEACANRYELATKKQETMKEYCKNKVPIDEIPKQEFDKHPDVTRSKKEDKYTFKY